jgi:hypothetical protein
MRVLAISRFLFVKSRAGGSADERRWIKDPQIVRWIIPAKPD